MLIPLGLVPTMQARVASMLEAIGYSARTDTPDPTGALTSPEPTPPVAKPSIERSLTSSSVSITVQAEPEPPLVYSLEPVPGSWPLQRLTVLYVPSLVDLGFPTPPSSDSEPSSPTLEVDDDEWIARVKSHHKDFA